MAISNVRLDFSKLNGLVPVVLQHADTKEVLMVGFVDEAAWEQTLRSGVVTLFRRTLGRLQVKGEEEGKVVPITVLLEVLPEATICHVAGASCFIKELAVPSGT